MRKLLIALGIVSTFVFCCSSFGQTSEKPAVPDPPRRKISSQERAALIALYQATDGDHWKEHGGWMGPEGTECKWYGIACATPIGVTSIELSKNNLSGTIPDAVQDLTQLTSLDVFGNHLSGKLPDALIQRWASGSLWLMAESSLFTAVTQVDFESSPSALLCGSHRIVFNSDGRAVSLTKRCRNATPSDRATYCEAKNGRILPGSFATLALLLERNGFYSLRPEYSLDITDSVFHSFRVIREGKATEVVEYAGGGPLELWVIENVIEGLASSLEWQKTKSIPNCPRWNEPKEPLPQ
jgi:hypothetical protein